MKLKNAWILGLAVLGMIGLSACTGPEGPVGPTGPQGPAGPGDQTTYVLNIDPAATPSGDPTVGIQTAGPSGLYISPAISDLFVGSNFTDYTTVVCYVRFSDGLGKYDTEAQALPYTDPDTNESIGYTIEDQHINLVWKNLDQPNPSDYHPFKLIVTLVNPTP
jgi:hypothetical protein